ncbi:MAG: hypothetical protein AAFQ64_00095 [Pseudomonadota bacterium]
MTYAESQHLSETQHPTVLGTSLFPIFEQASIALEPWQFRITQAPHPGATRLKQLWVSHAPDLPCIPVQDASGFAAGVLLGFPIDLTTGTCITKEWQAPGHLNLECETGVHQSLATLAGRYLWVCETSTMRRIYPDAATQISCVWDRETGSAGATALAILDEAGYAQRFDHAQFAMLCQENAGWFPAGLTAHAGVSRLLPNHYLDIDTWSAHRFDIRPQLPEISGPEETVEHIIQTISIQIGALMMADKPPLLSLTGGHETRMILACARQWADDLTFVTVAQGNHARQDMALAQKISQDHQLRHRLVEAQNADRAAQERYLRRTGHATADANLQQHATWTALRPGTTLIGGLGGHIARAPLWFEDDTHDMTVTAEQLVSRFGLLASDKTLRYLDTWLEGLAGEPADRILDLAVLENQLGPWAMAQFCGSPGIVRYLPFLSYPTVAQMQALPHEWKRSRALSRAIIGRLWPELLTYPFHTTGRFDTLLNHAKRVWVNRVDAMQRLRQRRG